MTDILCQYGYSSWEVLKYQLMKQEEMLQELEKELDLNE